MMKTSARNQFAGTVSDVHIGAVNAEVQVTLKSGIHIIAAITKESVETLGISNGKEVIALVKAPQIILVTDFGGYKISARNQLAGTVTQIQAGAVNTEVDINLSGGEKVAATITNESVTHLGLQKGASVTAVFKASAVLLAVAA
jgi:molybdate transport system regulatory protein